MKEKRYPLSTASPAPPKIPNAAWAVVPIHAPGFRPGGGKPKQKLPLARKLSFYFFHSFLPNNPIHSSTPSILLILSSSSLPLLLRQRSFRTPSWRFTHLRVGLSTLPHINLVIKPRLFEFPSSRSLHLESSKQLRHT